MKLVTPLVAWHNRDPVFSVDFHPESRRMATGGADHDVKIWRVVPRTSQRGEDVTTASSTEDITGGESTCTIDTSTTSKKGVDKKRGKPSSAAATLGPQHVHVEFLSNLKRHDKAVNVVRFSPSGDMLASGGDDAMILLWRLTDKPATSTTGMEEDENKEHWQTTHMLRGHLNDVYDLAWSPDSSILVSGSVDWTVRVWDTAKGIRIDRLDTHHKHYVQGIAYDPLGKHIVSQSHDRTCRVVDIVPRTLKGKPIAPKFSQSAVLSKVEVQLPQKTVTPLSMEEPDVVETSLPTKTTSTYLFQNEALPSFFRRLTFSPDGSLLILPAGLHPVIPTGEGVNGGKDVGDVPTETTPLSNPTDLDNVVYGYIRGKWNRPLFRLPGLSKPAVAVRFCPVIFEKFNIDIHENGEESQESPLIELPYRMVFAVATLDSLLIYDTQQTTPVTLVRGIHYAAITDIAWSADGRILVCTSQDGFLSFVTFSAGELGVPLPTKEMTQSVFDMNRPPASPTIVTDAHSEKRTADNIVTNELKRPCTDSPPMKVTSDSKKLRRVPLTQVSTASNAITSPSVATTSNNNNNSAAAAAAAAASAVAVAVSPTPSVGPNKSDKPRRVHLTFVSKTSGST